MDDWEKMSVEEYRLRLHAEHAAKRAEAHAQIDEFFDHLLADADLQLQVIKRDVAGAPIH